MNRPSPFDAFIPSPENPPVAPDFTIANGSDFPILGEANRTLLEKDCWNKIGVTGDRSCPELLKHVHCRNCPVFTSAGQQLFERDLPAGHLAEWTKRLAEPEVVAERGTVSVLIFRVGDEWLAIDIGLLVEIGELRPIHSIPNRSNEVLVGLVSIRGELELCISVGGLLGIAMQYPPNIAKSANESGHHRATDRDRITARLMVVSRAGRRWVFQVDEVEGVSRFTPAELTNVPSTVSGASASFAKGIFWRDERRIGFLDEVRLFETFERSLT